MRRRAGGAALAGMLLASFAAAADAPAPEGADGAVRAFERILSLWHDGSFEALHENGTAATRGLLRADEFRLRMSAEACRPACCFAAFRLAEAAPLGPGRVLVRGTVGFELRGPARPRRRCEPEERAYVLEWEEGRWRIPLTNLLSTF